VHVKSPQFVAAYEITKDSSNKAATDPAEFLHLLERELPEAARSEFRKRITVPLADPSHEADQHAQKWSDCAKQDGLIEKKKAHLRERVRTLVIDACENRVAAGKIVRTWITNFFSDDISVVEDTYYQLKDDLFVVTLATALHKANPCPGVSALPERMQYPLSYLAEKK
jgi:hypothetical protein